MAKSTKQVLPAEIDVVGVFEGTLLKCDGGFTCLAENQVVTVRIDKEGHLYVNCDEGHHDLSGQLSSHSPNKYVGFYHFNTKEK